MGTYNSKLLILLALQVFEIKWENILFNIVFDNKMYRLFKKLQDIKILINKISPIKLQKQNKTIQGREIEQKKNRY